MGHVRLTRAGRIVAAALCVAVAAGIVGTVAGIGSLTAHAATASHPHPGAGRATTAATPASPPTPAYAAAIPPRLAGASQGQWTTTDAAGHATVHDLARGVVTQSTPAVLTVRTSGGRIVSFAITSTADTIHEHSGGGLTTVPWNAIRAGEHVTVTGVIPAATGVPAVAEVTPAS